MYEKWDVCGFRRVNFKDEKEGRQISGYTLFLQRVPVSRDIEGYECCKQFVSSQYVDYVPNVGDTIQLVYNRYGKIGGIQTC